MRWGMCLCVVLLESEHAIAACLQAAGLAITDVDLGSSVQLNESHRERVPGWRQLAHRSTPPPSLEVPTIQSSRLGHEEVVHLIWLCDVDRT